MPTYELRTSFPLGDLLSLQIGLCFKNHSVQVGTNFLDELC